MLGFIFALCLMTPWLPLPDPDVTDLANRLKTPLSSNHWLGTDELGRDLLSRLLWGTRVSLVVGFVATLAAALVGSLIGLVSGYFQGWIDSGLMRGVDTLMAFPYMLLALAIVAAFGPGAPECPLCHCNSKCPLLRKNGSRSYDLFGKTRIYLGSRTWWSESL